MQIAAIVVGIPSISYFSFLRFLNIEVIGYDLQSFSIYSFVLMGYLGLSSVLGRFLAIFLQIGAGIVLTQVWDIKIDRVRRKFSGRDPEVFFRYVLLNFRGFERSVGAINSASFHLLLSVLLSALVFFLWYGNLSSLLVFVVIVFLGLVGFVILDAMEYEKLHSQESLNFYRSPLFRGLSRQERLKIFNRDTEEREVTTKGVVLREVVAVFIEELRSLSGSVLSGEGRASAYSPYFLIFVVSGFSALSGYARAKHFLEADPVLMRIGGQERCGSLVLSLSSGWIIIDRSERFYFAAADEVSVIEGREGRDCEL